MNTTKSTSRLLGAIVVMQVLTLLGQWTASPSLSPASAANPSSFPDPGARQVQMVEELKSLNGKMDRLLGVLESGKLQVQPVETDEKK